MDWRTIGLLIAAFAVNAVLIERLGWVISGALLFWGSAFALGNRHHVRGLAIGVALSLITFYAFAVGLGLAITFNDKHMRGRKFYRSLLIIPYALPGFMMALVFRGMLNRTFGINRWLGIDVGTQGVRAVLVDGHHLSVAVPLAAAARARGIPVLADGGSWKPGLDTLLGHVDVLVASADFRSPAGDGVDELLALGPTWVARSAGAGAVVWRAANGVGTNFAR